MMAQVVCHFMVAHVSVRAGNTFFQMLWIRSHLEHTVVVVGFQYQVISLLYEACGCGSDMPYVRQEGECLIACGDTIAHVVSSVVRHFETGDSEIAHTECFFFWIKRVRSGFNRSVMQ